MRNTGHGFGQSGQIHLAFIGAVKNARILHGAQQRNKIHGRAACEKAHNLGKNLAVLARIKHFCTQKLHHLGDGVCVQNCRAKHRLLRLHAIGQVYAHCFQR